MALILKCAHFTKNKAWVSLHMTFLTLEQWSGMVHFENGAKKELFRANVKLSL